MIKRLKPSERSTFPKFPKKYNFIVGVDPDIDASGVCLLNVDTEEVELYNWTITDFIDGIQGLKERCGDDLIVVVEASWLVKKSNLHGGFGGVAEKIAYSVGRNHQVGITLVDICKHYGVEVEEMRPLKKIWEGANGKISHKELSEFVNIPKRTNPETRDATLLAWTKAGLTYKTDFFGIYK